MTCYDVYDEGTVYDRLGIDFNSFHEGDQFSVCDQVVEELKIIAGNSWDESFESVFNRDVIYSDERVSQEIAFPIIEKMSEMLLQNYFVEMDAMVSDAEKTVSDDPNMTLSSKADVIYDIRRWEESTKQIHDRTPYSSLEVLKRTYNTLIEEDKTRIQAEIENKAEQEAKE